MKNTFSAVKGRLQSYCNKVYSNISFNQMWILKYYKDHLGSFISRFYSRKSHLSKQLTSAVYKPSLLTIY